MIIFADKEGVAVIEALVDTAILKGVFSNLKQPLALMSCVKMLPEPKDTEQAQPQTEIPAEEKKPAEEDKK